MSGSLAISIGFGTIIPELGEALSETFSIAQAFGWIRLGGDRNIKAINRINLIERDEPFLCIEVKPEWQ